jgi:hypothetical protein
MGIDLVRAGQMALFTKGVFAVRDSAKAH